MLPGSGGQQQERRRAAGSRPSSPVVARVFDPVKRLYLINLSAADLSVGCVCMMRGAMNTLGSRTLPLCSIRLLLTALSVATSMLLLTALTFYVYSRIAYPLHWSTHCTVRFHRYVILVIWAFCFSLHLIATLLMKTFCVFNYHESGDEECILLTVYPCHFTIFYKITFFIVPSLLICLCHVHILLIVRRSLRSALERSCPVDVRWSEYRGREHRRINSQFRHSCTVGLISAAFILCWMPINIVSLHRCISHVQPDDTVAEISFLVWYLNSFLNPIIYCWRIAAFRDNLVHVFRSTLCLSKRRVAERTSPCEGFPMSRNRISAIS